METHKFRHILGIHAPPELRDKLDIRGDEQCALMGGAYGRIDAPYLWYKAFRETLENLGFITCPLDGCLFSLVTPEKDGTPRVRGVLGIHVDDGIGGGDDYFHSVLQQLKGIYDFGAYNEGDFEFCGVRYRQWDDGTIEMDQNEYLRRIEPVEIPKHRRADPKSDLTPVEVQQLRRICGSLQFAAVHTRPDLSAKVGQLQSMVTKGQVQISCLSHGCPNTATSSYLLFLFGCLLLRYKGSSFASGLFDLFNRFALGKKRAYSSMSHSLEFSTDSTCGDFHFEC